MKEPESCVRRSVLLDLASHYSVQQQPIELAIES